MSGWEGSSSSGSGLPFWSNDCEAPANPANLSHTVLAPPEDVTFHPGEQINISWHSGIRADVLKIDGPPWAGGFHPASWQWSAFLQSEDEKTSVTIIDNQNFTFGYDVAWTVLGDCTNSAINQTWTIPTSLDITETIFNVVVVNMTNPDTQSSTTGPAFTIKAGKPTSGGTTSPSSTANEPSFAAATATATSTSDESPISTTAIQTPTLSAAPAEGDTSQAEGGGGQGLGVGAKAGIGAGVGVSALFFLLALLLFWRRRRRSPGTEGATPNSDEEKGCEQAKKAGVELEGNNRRAAVEAEAPVPRELAATSNDDEEDVKTPGSALSVNFDPYAPRYPSGPVEMPANELFVAEMPDNSSPVR